MNIFSELLSELLESYWTSRHDRIMKSLTNAWSQLDTDGKHAFMNALPPQQVKAIDMLCENYNLSHLARTTKELCIKIDKAANRLPAAMYITRHTEGMAKGLEGDDLLDYIFSPCTRWNDDLIKFFDMVFELHQFARPYLAMKYDGNSTVDADKMLKNIQETVNGYWIWARDVDIMNNKSMQFRAELKQKVIELTHDLSSFGIE